MLEKTLHFSRESCMDAGGRIDVSVLPAATSTASESVYSLQTLTLSTRASMSAQEIFLIYVFLHVKLLDTVLGFIHACRFWMRCPYSMLIAVHQPCHHKQCIVQVQRMLHRNRTHHVNIWWRHMQVMCVMFCICCIGWHCTTNTRASQLHAASFLKISDKCSSTYT